MSRLKTLLGFVLVATAAAFVEQAQIGYFVDELDNLLRVGTKDVLRKLAREGRVVYDRDICYLAGASDASGGSVHRGTTACFGSACRGIQFPDRERAGWKQLDRGGGSAILRRTRSFNRL